MGLVRFKIHDAAYQASVTTLRNAMDENDCDAAWSEGAALSIEEAIAYAQRGRGEPKRLATGWASLTPAERDVARLVCEGLANKEIARGYSCHRGPCKHTSATSTPNWHRIAGAAAGKRRRAAPDLAGARDWARPTHHGPARRQGDGGAGWDR